MVVHIYGIKMNQLNKEICEPACIEHEKVAAVKKKMKSETVVFYLAETFKVLGDPTRTKIIYALCHEKELCVCDIANILSATKSAISHQLRVLRNMKLVKYRKEGKIVYYSLDDDHIRSLFDEGLRHVEDLTGEEKL